VPKRLQRGAKELIGVPIMRLGEEDGPLLFGRREGVSDPRDGLDV
jgi:hypothetical protein